MKLSHILLVVCLLSVAWAQDEEGVKPRPLGLLRRGALQKNQLKPTSTTTTPAPKEEELEEYEDEEGAVDEDIVENEPEPTSTEATKKIGGVVRPFRSNDDLLAALKRRRAEAANGKIHLHEQTTSTRAPEPIVDNTIGHKHNAGGRRRFNSPQKNEPPAEESTPSPVKPNRNRFSGRASYKSNVALTDNPEITGLESKQRSVEIKPRAGYRRFQ